MLAEIQETVTATRGATAKARLTPEVMAALGKVPRHEFVPDKLDAVAYANRPLPVGHGQTISQPYIVANPGRIADRCRSELARESSFFCAPEDSRASSLLQVVNLTAGGV